MSTIDWILACLTGLTALATVLPLSRNPHWIVRGLDFPRMQIAVIALLLLGAQLVFLELDHASSWVMIGATFLCAAWQLRWVLPYTLLWRKEVADASDERAEQHLSIITANVLTPNRRADALISLVKEHKPDVLVTLESDQWWQEQLRVLESDMPHTIKCPLDNLYGMHVYSRLPLEDAKVSFLVEEDVPSVHTLLVLQSGDRVRAHFLHPAPPSPSENEESSERDAELLVVAKSIVESKQPIIVTGDLNDVAWSATTRLFRKMSGLLDPRVGRGMFNTFHASYPFLRWPLDHVFHSGHFKLLTIKRLPFIGSDHFPLLTRLVFSKSERDPVNGLESDAEDRERANNITLREHVSKQDVPKPGAE